MSSDRLRPIYHTARISTGYMILVTILLTAFYFLCPYQNDDIWYISPNIDFKSGLSQQINWHEGIDALRWHYDNDNGRFSNMSTILTLVVLPKWIFNILTGIIIFLIFRLTWLISTTSKKDRVMAGIVVVSAITLLLPWYNFIFVADFTLNYIWPSLGMLFGIWLFVYPKVFSSAKLWMKILICLLLFIAGGFHEAAAVPACAFMFVYMLFDRRGDWRWRIVMLIMMAAGASVPLTCPAMDFKAEYQVGFQFRSLLNMVVPCFLCYIFWFTALIDAVCRKKMAFTKLANTERTIIYALCCATLSSFLIYIYSGAGGDRVMWFGELLAICGLTIYFTKFRLRLKQIISAVAVIITFIHMGVAIYWQYRLYQQSEHIHNEYLKSDDGIVYYDMIDNGTISPLALGKPLKTQFMFGRYGATIWCNDSSAVRMEEEGKNLCILPTRIKYMSPDKGRLINAKDSIYELDGLILGKNNKHYVSVRVTNDEGTIYNVDVHLFKFSFQGEDWAWHYMLVPRRFIGDTIVNVEPITQ